METFRKEFPVLRKGIYANTAVYGLLYESLLDWRQEHDLDFLLYGSDMRSKTLKILTNTRTAVGAFFNCKRENVALINNFSTGLNMLLEGMNKKKKVLLLENDYPSLNWAFENRDFDIEYLGMTDDIEERILEKIGKEQIDVFALSLVQWLDGFFIAPQFLKKLKGQYPNLTIIADGYGNGFMLFSDNVQQEFSINAIGFNSANGDMDKKDTVRFAKLFEPGHLSSLSFGSLNYSLDYFNKIGMDKITLHNKSLSEKAKDAFMELGLLDQKFKDRKLHSTIFNIKASEATFQHLLSKDIYCAQRGEGVRLSFHFYNTEEEISTIIKILKTRT